MHGIEHEIRQRHWIFRCIPKYTAMVLAHWLLNSVAKYTAAIQKLDIFSRRMLLVAGYVLDVVP